MQFKINEILNKKQQKKRKRQDEDEVEVYSSDAAFKLKVVASRKPKYEGTGLITKLVFPSDAKFDPTTSLQFHPSVRRFEVSNGVTVYGILQGSAVEGMLYNFGIPVCEVSCVAQATVSMPLCCASAAMTD